MSGFQLLSAGDCPASSRDDSAASSEDLLAQQDRESICSASSSSSSSDSSRSTSSSSNNKGSDDSDKSKKGGNPSVTTYAASTECLGIHAARGKEPATIPFWFFCWDPWRFGPWAMSNFGQAPISGGRRLAHNCLQGAGTALLLLPQIVFLI